MEDCSSVITAPVPRLLRRHNGGSGNGDGGNGSSGSGDFLKLTVDVEAESTYSEAFDPDIVCDPRVDWASSQTILWNNHLGSSNWELIFDIMLLNDAVGTYDVTVAADGVNISYILNTVQQYYANFSLSNSTGTVIVTRSDTRIEGTFNIVVVDAGNSNPITLAGSFGVEKGNSLSCQ